MDIIPANRSQSWQFWTQTRVDCPRRWQPDCCRCSCGRRSGPSLTRAEGRPNDGKMPDAQGKPVAASPYPEDSGKIQAGGNHAGKDQASQTQNSEHQAGRPSTIRRSVLQARERQPGTCNSRTWGRLREVGGWYCTSDRWSAIWAAGNRAHAAFRSGSSNVFSWVLPWESACHAKREQRAQQGLNPLCCSWKGSKFSQFPLLFNGNWPKPLKNRLFGGLADARKLALAPL